MHTYTRRTVSFTETELKTLQAILRNIIAEEDAVHESLRDSDRWWDAQMLLTHINNGVDEVFTSGIDHPERRGARYNPWTGKREEPTG